MNDHVLTSLTFFSLNWFYALSVVSNDVIKKTTWKSYFSWHSVVNIQNVTRNIKNFVQMSILLNKTKIVEIFGIESTKRQPHFDVLVKAPFLKSYLEGKNVEFLICNKMNLLLIILDLSIIYIYIKCRFLYIVYNTYRSHLLMIIQL